MRISPNDWRVPLATDLAIRCHGAGVDRENRDLIRRSLEILAEEEKKFLAKYPGLIHEALGYQRAVTEYGKTGIAMLISLAQKYWPEEKQKQESASERLLRKTTSKPPVVLKSVDPVLKKPEPLDYCLRVTTLTPFDESSVVKHFKNLFSESTQFEDARRDGSVIETTLSTQEFVSEICEKIQNIEWVNDVVTLPVSMRSI